MSGNQVALGDRTSGHARVTFTAFRSADEPMLRAWARFREPLAATTRPAGATARPEPGAVAVSVAVPTNAGLAPVRRAPTHADTRASGLWRLLATNNRELGRSFLLYASLDAARAHVLTLQASSAELDVALVAGPVNASHGWIVSLDGAAVMTCSRWYTSTSTSITSMLGALAALPAAVLSDDADRSTPSGRFRRRAAVRNHVDSW